MEPLDTDLDYVVREPHELNPQKRFNWLYSIPILGAIWLVFLAAAAIFQWPIAALVDPVMSFMILLLFIMAGLLFWAMAPKANR
ncbi:MAG TPA: hypothetical protein VKR06_03360 [Ktedonosporobacter sp.]|nr:hypothetical protein [Ktedonosporobacter sp.]